MSLTSGFNLALALIARTRVAIAEGDPEQAERDAHKALAWPPPSMRTRRYRTPWNASPPWRATPRVTSKPPGSSARQTRSAAAWDWSGSRSTTPTTTPRLRRSGMRWATTSLSRHGPRARHCRPSEAIAYAQRGRGERKRPTSGWASLTPTELDVVRLVSEGLANKDIATRLFISPRTVQTHLTHVYTKLGLTSRVQLAQEAARRA